ncbi:MAG: ferritin-like domain-containing protein [Acidimicrobiia bacterium]
MLGLDGLDGLDRRRFIRLGGVTVATAAIVAACVGDDEKKSADETGTRRRSENDATILRTASSIEALAVEVYRTAIESDLVTTKTIADAAKLFQSQHQEHGALFEAETENAAEPFTDPNPVLVDQLRPTIDALDSETGVIQLAYDLEVVAANTYQANVGSFDDNRLNQALMSVGGVEARHAALLAASLGLPSVPSAFQVTDDALRPGTGI